MTLIGGGAFGNKKKWIYESMLAAHHKWANHEGSCLERVTLVLFSDKDVYLPFTEMLKEKGIPYKWYEYTAGRPREKEKYTS